MNWVMYSILAYLTIAMQLALGDILAWGGASPNLVLPVVIFIALHAKREEALMGAFILGVLQDLGSQQPAGLYAFSYGLASLFVVGARPTAHRDHLLVYLLVTLAGGVLTGAVMLLNDWAYPVLHPAPNWPKPSVFRGLAGVVYSTLLAVLLFAGLVRLKPLLGFRSSRSHISPARYSGSSG